MAIEQIPTIIETLQNQETNITTNSLARVVDENILFGRGFNRDDFVAYINSSEALGPIDITSASFRGRGKKREVPRSVVCSFVVPRYQGLTIIGKPGVIKEILRSEGDRVTFHLETTRDGVSIVYE